MAPYHDLRWRRRLQSFGRVLRQLDHAAALAGQRPLTELETLGVARIFQYTHELAWKTLKDFLESRGATGIVGSRDAVREAFSAGLLEDGELWAEMLSSRNRTSHLYQEEMANEVAKAILSRYLSAFAKLRATMESFAFVP